MLVIWQRYPHCRVFISNHSGIVHCVFFPSHFRLNILPALLILLMNQLQFKHRKSWRLHYFCPGLIFTKGVSPISQPVPVGGGIKQRPADLRQTKAPQCEVPAHPQLTDIHLPVRSGSAQNKPVFWASEAWFSPSLSSVLFPALAADPASAEQRWLLRKRFGQSDEALHPASGRAASHGPALIRQARALSVERRALPSLKAEAVLHVL